MNPFILALERSLTDGCSILPLGLGFVDDVLKARLKTVGVSEYKFEMEIPAGRDTGTEWRIVDVGGSRSQVCSKSRSVVSRKLIV